MSELPDFSGVVWFHVIIWVSKNITLLDLQRLWKEQEELAREVALRDGFDIIKSVGGADSSYQEGRVFTSVVVCSFHSLKVVEKSFYTSKERPYTPGYLFYREGASIIGAFKSLENKPDILLVDAHGICHPRGLGMASHVGLALGKPTIGVAKSLHCGKVMGECVYMKGRKVGWVLETKAGRKPVFVSPGHKVSLASSRDIVMSCIRGNRIPEPLRLAHLNSREGKNY